MYSQISLEAWKLQWWAPQASWQPLYHRGRSNSCPGSITGKDDRPGLGLAQRPGTLEEARQTQQTHRHTDHVEQGQMGWLISGLKWWRSLQGEPAGLTWSCSMVEGGNFRIARLPLDVSQRYS